MRRTLALASLVVLVAFAACDDSSPEEAPTATPRALPSPVTIRDEPQGIGLEDPAFDALPGATAYHGRLGGTVYQMEMPDDWNGRLVLYMHGFQGLAPEASVQTPGIRTYLVRRGYAWAASSYSSTALIPGRAADETAALWDEFVRRFGRPAYTYVTGHSMGGAATHIAAERYADRFDGALGLCGFAGQSAIAQIVGDTFFAGAYAAGVTQQQFDAKEINALIEQTMIPALREPSAHQRWVDIMIDLTGGPRALAEEGFVLEEDTNWFRAPILVSFGLAYNVQREYRLGPGAGVSAADFNASVVRRSPATEEQVTSFISGNEITGELAMPMLTLHTTGDWQVPIDQQQMLRRAADLAGKGGLLVQRIVRAAEHCGFLEREWTQALEDLVAWVEEGVVPEGDDVLVDDLANAGTRFTLAPRAGTPEGDSVPGADGRVRVSGTLTRDGAPLDAYIWVEVIDEAGRRQSCGFAGPSPSDGRYERVIPSDAEQPGCGAPGRSVRIAAYDDGYLYAERDAPWPTDGRELELDATMLPGEPRTRGVWGNISDLSGDLVKERTVVEAYVGDTLCGAAGVPRTVMVFTAPDSYDMQINRDLMGCDVLTYELHVNGERAQDVTFDPAGADSQRVDLVMQD
jgi:pimeloyl-ACP methyl ester carboxylesterase